MTRIDVASSMERHNVEEENGRLYVRRAFREHLLPATLLAGTEFVAGFSLEMPATGDVMHYLFVQSTTTRAVTLYITDEEYNVQVTYSCGVTARRPRITYAVQTPYILISSPHFTRPIWGLAGGGVIAAVKVASINPDTTALDIPVGICSTWGDRVVIAFGDLLYVSDPSQQLTGIEIRTFVAQNAIALSGTVYDLFEDAGALTAVTSAGVFTLPRDALGQGQLVSPFVADRSTAETSGFGNSALSPAGVALLSRDGLIRLDDNAEVALTRYAAPRALSKPVGVPRSSDYRLTGQVWPSEHGHWVSVNGKLCLVGGKSATWHYAATDLDLVGMLSSREAGDILIARDRIVSLWGNVEFDSNAVVGAVCGTLKSAPTDSMCVRFVSTSSDNAGRLNGAAVNGLVRSGTTRAPFRAANLIGTNVWATTTTYSSAQSRSYRHAYPGMRVNALDVEVSATGSRALLGDGELEAKGQARKRGIA